MTNVGEELAGRIRTLDSTGLGVFEIAEKLGVGARTVWNVVFHRKQVTCKCGKIRLLGQGCSVCQSRWERRIREELTGDYIRRLLKWPDAPPEIIELKRAKILMKRKLKK